jgi:histidine triad (HIT) family protein
MASEDGCPFCGIVAGDVPAEIVRIGQRVVAFRDLNPQAPLHALVVPRDHHADVAALAAADPEALAELVEVAQGLGAPEGDGSYRLVFNSGAGAGQSVFHVHGHVLAGRPFQWPPG